ncbi:inorganic phosphate transporter 2-1 [Forsythia ovata]|uniref:Inorganic phosphate transporter 2-1 n=1 Tax=Forsythia ovata TaxID=205694 RepID=A0ABD1VDH1_9LAMI
MNFCCLSFTRNTSLSLLKHRSSVFCNESRFPKKELLILKPQQPLSKSSNSLVRLGKHGFIRPFVVLSSFAEAEGEEGNRVLEVKEHQENVKSDDDELPGMAKAFHISSNTASAISICIAFAALTFPLFMTSLGQGLSFKTKLLSYVTFLFGFYMAWNIGANDVSNAMGTSVGSGAFVSNAMLHCLKCHGNISWFWGFVSPAGRFDSCSTEFSGALLMGTHVSNTMQKGILVADVFQGKDTNFVNMCLHLLMLLKCSV